MAFFSVVSGLVTGAEFLIPETKKSQKQKYSVSGTNLSIRGTTHIGQKPT